MPRVPGLPLDPCAALVAVLGLAARDPPWTSTTDEDVPTIGEPGDTPFLGPDVW
jgi:hypothetical protein